MRKVFLVVLSVAILLLAACGGQQTETVTVESQPAPEPVEAPTPVPDVDEEVVVEPEPTPEPEPEPLPPASSGATIEMSSSGFSPKTVTVSVGDTVTWTSVDGQLYWPASIVHPTHTVYPNSGISKCGGSADIFDACGAMDSFSFTFNEAGEWSYHNHLSPGRTGTVIVE